ncbi:MAG TPA: Flp pilus assembly protein CpaB [Gaiellaceae bacterium]|jgi:Flp pilus assembly protein CpaB|nr:Flp pilus assembly protein CpaB [Gaiellaceae bacterium]
MTYRIRNIVIAVGLALVAMMLTLLYVTNYRKSVQHGAATVQVYVAAKDIPSGTSGADLVKQGDLRQLSMPRSDVVPGAISNPDQIKNLLLVTSLYDGEQVTLRRFANAAAQGIRAQLHGTMRAIQVGGDPNQLMAGTLQEGDHVDLVASIHKTANSSNAASLIVLHNLLVLVPPATTSPSKLSSPGGTSSIILQVSDTQVQRLFYVVKNADWSLELRPVSDATDSAGGIATAGSILKEGSR